MPRNSKVQYTYPALPKTRARLDLSLSFTDAETQLLAEGFVPQDMEDKWLIHRDGNWLIFRRSWTGFAIYGLLFERTDSGSRVSEAWVSREVSQYTGQDAPFEGELVRYLIATALLNIPAEFPSNSAYQRLVALLNSESTQSAEGLRLCTTLTHREIASRIAAAQPTVTRLLRGLRAGGFIRTHRRRITLLRNLPDKW